MMKVSINELAYLSNRYKTKTALSLFANLKAEVKGNEEKTLKEKGVLVGSNLSAEAESMLKIAVNAQKCTHLVLRDNYCVIEKYVYNYENKYLLVENEDGELLLSIPDNWNEIIDELSEFLGLSRIMNASIEIELDKDSLFVVLALVDLSRKHNLINYFDSNKKAIQVKEEDIFNHLKDSFPNSLVGMIKNNYGFIIPKKDKIKEILDVLMKKEHLVLKDGYELKGELLTFSQNFLIPEAIVILETFNIEKNNTISSASLLSVSAGIRDIALFIFGSDLVEFSTISGMQLMQIIENFLNCPDV